LGRLVTAWRDLGHAIELVGPGGWEHGWIPVRPPATVWAAEHGALLRVIREGDGIRATHPLLGHVEATVTRAAKSGQLIATVHKSSRLPGVRDVRDVAFGTRDITHVRRSITHAANVDRRRSAEEIAREAAIHHGAVQTAKMRSVMTEEQRTRDTAQDAHLHQMQRQIRNANIRVNKLQESVAAGKSKTKFAAIAASMVGGAILSGAEAKLGVPGLAQIATSIGPGLAEALFEWKRRL
jgi:hypothetical protein